VDCQTELVLGKHVLFKKSKMTKWDQGIGSLGNGTTDLFFYKWPLILP